MTNLQNVQLPMHIDSCLLYCFVCEEIYSTIHTVIKHMAAIIIGTKIIGVHWGHGNHYNNIYA